jgi:hypothetical protein
LNPRKCKVNEGKLGKMDVSKFEKVGHWMSAQKLGDISLRKLVNIG